MRNPSKNTIKKLMRPANGHGPGWGMRGITFAEWNSPEHLAAKRSYFLFNQVGARLYHMSKGRMCNREPKGYEKYLTPEQMKMPCNCMHLSEPKNNRCKACGGAIIKQPKQRVNLSYE